MPPLALRRTYSLNSYSLITATEGEPAIVVAELKTMPQILSTQTEGEPVCISGSLVLVAHGIVIQSVVHCVPTMLPCCIAPPVMLNDMAGEFTVWT